MPPNGHIQTGQDRVREPAPRAIGVQEKEITRVGGTHPIKADFRCIAATNKSLSAMVGQGQFRLDLYYRLNVFCIEVPPLRERREDIPLLVDHFMRKFSQSMNKKISRVSPQAMALLQQCEWPGNVRELENAVERAMVVAHERELLEQDFTLRMPAASPEGRTIAEIERQHILRVLEECGENQSRASERLIKEGVHELGHTAGPVHCADYSCAMSSSHAVEWIDLKGSNICPGCRARARPG